MAVKVGINGFGRIGRNIFRTALGDPDIDFVAVNDLTDTKTLAHLLKYDSVLGNLDHEISSTENGIKVDNEEFRVFSQRDPAAIDWESVGAEIVVESTGIFTKAEDAKKHMRGTVKKVIISAPAKNEDFKCVVYDELSGAGGESGAREVRHSFSADDDDSLVHERSATARPPA
jgi:glyceraldehyde 3-phosphate dehydrogenase